MGRATRLLWMVFAPFEFVVTIAVAVLLYLGVAILLYLGALWSSLKRAVTLAVHRFRVGPILSSADESTTATMPPLFEAPTRGPAGRGRFHSSLN